MIVEFSPSAARGAISAPPSKSDAHRTLMAAALAHGTSVIDNLTASDDLLATVACLRALGARIRWRDDSAAVTGLDVFSIPAGAVLPCRSSGSTLRFLIPVALLSGKEIHFIGTERLFSRPLSVYEELCRERGLRFDRSGDGLTVCGRLSPGTYTVPGNVSSQFISGLAFALPLLDGDSAIHILPPVESRPYIAMTLDTLSAFGVETAWNDSMIGIKGGQSYLPRRMAVEGDWSQASFFQALNLLRGSVRITGLRSDSLQGDKVFPAYYAALREGTPTLNLSDCPDLGPICMALAAALHGSVFTGTRRLRDKESDRCAAMAAELAKFGARVQAADDTVTVYPSALRAPSQPLWGHDDHRVVMALSVLLSGTGGVICGAEAVSKSMPDFFERLRSLGVACRVLPETQGEEPSHEHGI